VNPMQKEVLVREKAYPKVNKKIPGPNAVRWFDYHFKHSSHTTYVSHFIWDKSRPAIGPFCTDVDGNMILDFVSHVASNALGYNNPELLALNRLFTALPDRHAGCDFIMGYGPDPEHSEIPTPSHLHHKMIEITSKFGFSKGFFTNSGAEAVENAIKICYDSRRNRGIGICFDGAFHGRTLGALSLNRSKTVQRKWYPSIPTVSLPYCACKGKCTCGWMKKTTRGDVTGRLTQMLDKQIGVLDPDEVAYIIIEPMQGEGGYNVANKEFMKEVYKIANANGIPVIADEIQAGLGRTGKMWAIEHYGLKPDVITAAKALQVGATVGKKEMFPDEDGRISSTWGEGNAHAAAIGYKTVEIIQRQKLIENADKMGKYLRKRLTELMDKKSHIIDVRGLGLMDAIEFETKKQRDDVLAKAMQKGLILLGCGYKTLRLLPPMDVRRREIDICIDILSHVMKKT